MTKKELLAILDVVDTKEQTIRAKAIDEMGGWNIPTARLFKMLDDAEGGAIKAHEVIEQVKQMVEENFGDIIEL